MATLNTPIDVVTSFIDGRHKAPRYASIVRSDRYWNDPSVAQLNSYGAHFPLIRKYIGKSGKVETLYIATEGNDKPGYSRTTDRHVRAAHIAADRCGFKATGETITERGHKMAEYTRRES